jgi:hypothetical protein
MEHRLPVGAWSTGGAMNTARQGAGGAGASNTSSIAFGGETGGPGDRVAITELYDGTSWTEVNDMNSARSIGSNGTQTSALAYGGYVASW